MLQGTRSSTMESDIVDQFNDPPLDTSPSTPAASTPDRLPPLKVPITLYRFFTIALGLALASRKPSALRRASLSSQKTWIGFGASSLLVAFFMCILPRYVKCADIDSTSYHSPVCLSLAGMKASGRRSALDLVVLSHGLVPSDY